MLLWGLIGGYIIYQLIKHNPITEKNFISSKITVDKWQ